MDLDLRAELRATRRALRMTQEQLAERWHVRRQYILRIEGGAAEVPGWLPDALNGLRLDPAFPKSQRS